MHNAQFTKIIPIFIQKHKNIPSFVYPCAIVFPAFIIVIFVHTTFSYLCYSLKQNSILYANTHYIE